MGKDLKGRELGVGISQLKNGNYCGRFVNKAGKRVKKEFVKLQECRKWLSQSRLDDEQGRYLFAADPTVDEWYQYWKNNVKGDNIRSGTKDAYDTRYRINIKPFIGNMLLKDVKPLHCQNILNRMAEKYKNALIRNTRIVMYMLFDSAVENEMISRNPITKSVKCTSGKKSVLKNALTIDEHQCFLEIAKQSTAYNQYAFALQTGLRAGELIGLKWSDVDLKNKIIHIERTMRYDSRSRTWLIGEPKTTNSFRDVPLTQEAVSILMDQKEKNKTLKVLSIEYSDLVFLHSNGAPRSNQSYDINIRRLCKKAGMREISMHIFRHTFATRCIESGMRPKTLQMILGHANISMTMDRYVHVTDDEKVKEMENIEGELKVI